MRKLVKVCGMRDADNIRSIEALGIDMMGLIFYEKSPRFVSERPGYLPVSCKRVGVFVDQAIEYVLAKTAEFCLEFIQFHGHETPQYIRSFRLSGTAQGLKTGIIKAIHIGSAEDLACTKAYEGLCDYFLFDTKCAGSGGSGRSFNWEFLSSYKGSTPFFLSGGLGPGSAGELQKLVHPLLAGYDLNSRFETQPGLKDKKQLEHFLEQIDNE